MFFLRLLLASFTFVILTVQAAPLPKRNTPLLTVPLKRIHRLRSDLPAEIQHQQHVNRAHRRHARMTGREEPSHEELLGNLHRRMLSTRLFNETEVLAVTGASGLDKRYSRLGTDSKGMDGKTFKSLDGPATNNAAASKDNSATGTAGNAAAANPNANGFDRGSFDRLNKGGLTPANKPKSANSLGLDVESNDVGYIATFQIGTPPRDFKLLTDSGSADTWVGGENCSNADIPGRDCGNHTFLGSNSSSTFVDTRAAFQVTYGAGAVAGTKVTDDFVVSGLKLPKHTFGAAILESNEFARATTTFDGLMGLAQSTLSNQRVPTPPEALAKAGLIKAAATSYRISRLADGLNDGEITFGGIDETTIDPKTLVTVDNLSRVGFWEAAMTLSVDGKDTGLKGRSAILDTGTTLIIAPPADALALHSQIPGAKSSGDGSFLIPCTTSTSVAMKFGSQTFTIDPRDLLFAPATNDLKGDCISGISAGTIGTETQWLVGDVFLKNVIFSHDVGKNSISLAVPKVNAAAQNTASGSSSSSNSSSSNSTASSTSAKGAGAANTVTLSSGVTSTKASEETSVSASTKATATNKAAADSTASLPSAVTVTVTQKPATVTVTVSAATTTSKPGSNSAVVDASASPSSTSASANATTSPATSTAKANGGAGTTTRTTTVVVTVKPSPTA